MRDSNTIISSVQLDQINLSLPTDERNNLKALLAELTGSNHWRDMQPMRGYANGEIDRQTGIKLFWNDHRPDSKHIMNGRLVCIIPGSYLKTLSLFSQQTILKQCWKAYKVSQLHLKAEVSNPPVTIHRIDDYAKLSDKTKGNSMGYGPYRSNVLIDSSTKQSGISSATLCFPKNYRGKKATVIYDPLFKHGIKNSQHWEFRMSDEYVDKHLPDLLVDYPSEYELAMVIKDIVFDSIDFRVGKDRASWYEEIRKAPLAF